MLAPWRDRGVDIKARKRAKSHLNYRKFVLTDNFLARLEIFISFITLDDLLFSILSLSLKKRQ